MKLGIGTVQFGMNYGLTCSLKPLKEEIKKIINLAKIHNISAIDTAPAYGNAEVLLGEELTEEYKWIIITKTLKFGLKSLTSTHIDNFVSSFYTSLKNLKTDSVYGLMIHKPQDLIIKDGFKLYEQMQLFKQKGLVKKIGVSVYNSNEIDQILNNFKIDIIQVPLNIFDQRLIQSGHLSLLKKKDIEIHARSIFLQGLLLMSSEEAYKKISLIEISSLYDKYYRFLQDNNITPLEGCVNFVKNIPEVDTVIVGINSSDHLKAIIDAYNKDIVLDFSQLSTNNEGIIDPGNWSFL